ncbi:hypothetical protein P7C70_g6340, partial [Phenoliferia sp. Uapishka_3]
MVSAQQYHQPNGQGMVDYNLNDDSLDPIQDIFQQFEQEQANSSSDSYSSSHSHSGASDSGLDTAFDSDLMMLYLNTAPGMGGDQSQTQSGGIGGGGQDMMGLGMGQGTGLVQQPSYEGAYGSDGSSPGYGASHYSATTSHSTPSFDNSGLSPPYGGPSSDFGTSSSASRSASQSVFPTYHQQSYTDPASFRAPSSISSMTAPTAYAPQHQLQSNSSLSPPSSAASSDGNFGQQGFIPNEALARMIASAQVQGQAQAQQQQSHNQENARISAQYVQAQAQAQAMAQAAFNASYSASLNISQRNAYPNSVSPHQQQSTIFQDNQGMFSAAAAAVEGRPHQVELPTLDNGDKKKRKITPIAPARSVGKPGGPVRSHKAQGIRKASPAAQSAGQPMSISDDAAAFSYSMKPTPGSVAAAMANVPTNSVHLIANAGLPAWHDAKKVYREELSQKLPINRAGAPSLKVQPPAPPMAKRPAEKKPEKVAKKSEKRKKGDKGHNAVERRYRNNINNAIATLRDIVPALRHLKPLPSMPASRRRASQFTLSTAAQAPTPAGLIDGIPAAKTLSKGTILSKAIEYIQYLQGAREDAAEDIEIFKGVVKEMVAGGASLIDTFEERRAVREIEREKAREITRAEQALLDDEDDSDAEEEEEVSTTQKDETVSDPDDAKYQGRPQQQTGVRQSSLDGLAQLRHFNGAGGMYGYPSDAFTLGSPNNPFP